MTSAWLAATELGVLNVTAAVLIADSKEVKLVEAGIILAK